MDDIHTEYNAIVSYHTAIVNSRFTIAGLFVAGLGILGSGLLRSDVPPRAKIFGAALALFLSFCFWVLELRSRALYTNLAMRGIDIEHQHFGLTGRNSYAGFFSRQYKITPKDGHADSVTVHGPVSDPNIPKIPPGPDRPRVAFLLGKPLPERLSRGVTHILGFDLLSGGSFLFWAFFVLWYVRRLAA